MNGKIKATIAKGEERRGQLIKEMHRLAEQGKDCSHCTGVCCTFEKNSMRVTPLEALEIFDYLVATDRWNQNLVDRLNRTVQEFRLDATLLVGARHTFRRTYTCPFFTHHALGCSLDVTVKPYGCLAFNATRSGVRAGESCVSNQESLWQREKVHDRYEEQLNNKLKEVFSLAWDKESIPVALLAIADKRQALSESLID